MDLLFFKYFYLVGIWDQLDTTCCRTLISLLLRMNPTLFREDAAQLFSSEREKDLFEKQISFPSGLPRVSTKNTFSPSHNAISKFSCPWVKDAAFPCSRAVPPAGTYHSPDTLYNRPEEAHGLLLWASCVTEWPW